MESGVLIRCDDCDKALLFEDDEVLVLNTNSIVFPKEPYAETGNTVVGCPHCGGNQVMPVKYINPKKNRRCRSEKTEDRSR